MLTELLENALNRNLPQSPRAQELCRELNGRRLGVEATGGIFSIVVESAGTSLRLIRGGAAQAPANKPPEAQVLGSPLALLALAGSDPEAVIHRGDVQITGDAEIAQQFRELAMLLRPDIEEALAQFVGDAPAHYAARFVRMALGWGRRTADTTVRNIAEYLSHERGDLVPRAEADSQMREVDALREDVDRLEARLAALAGKGRGARP
ncbi:MAG: SCP2 sterol-binding domain-containing protein [Steroidobacteraceae bacterium]